jgi:hypothetical protein
MFPGPRPSIPADKYAARSNYADKQSTISSREMEPLYEDPASAQFGCDGHRSETDTTIRLPSAS